MAAAAKVVAAAKLCADNLTATGIPENVVLGSGWRPVRAAHPDSDLIKGEQVYETDGMALFLGTESSGSSRAIAPAGIGTCTVIGDVAPGDQTAISLSIEEEIPFVDILREENSWRKAIRINTWSFMEIDTHIMDDGSIDPSDEGLIIINVIHSDDPMILPLSADDQRSDGQ